MMAMPFPVQSQTMGPCRAVLYSDGTRKLVREEEFLEAVSPRTESPRE
jgi:predicted nucleotide-binding protein (sugar kinase/HSP70/actin superfamily)